MGHVGPYSNQNAVPAILHQGEYVFTKGETRSFSSLLKQAVFYLSSIKGDVKDTAKGLWHTIKSTVHGIKHEATTSTPLPFPFNIIANTVKRGVIAPQIAISKMFTKFQRGLFAGQQGGEEKRAFFEKHGLLVSDDQKKKQKSAGFE